MIEDVDLTKRILQEVADEKFFPASLRAEDFRKLIYPDDTDYETKRRKISYHIILANQNGLVIGGDFDRGPIDRANYRVRPVDA